MEQGFNHNIEHRSVLFHIQTEDSGSPQSAIRTHLFFEGQILKSVESHPAESECAEEMKRQHKSMIAQLINGELDQLITEAGIELITHQWPFEVPTWLAQLAPPTFLKAKVEPQIGEEAPNQEVMRETIERCTSDRDSNTSQDMHELEDVVTTALEQEG